LLQTKDCCTHSLLHAQQDALTQYKENSIQFNSIGWGGMNWTDLAQDWDWWRVIVNMVMNLSAP
jgi:hypothetical protein